jgi:hypothetical protein
MYRRTTSFEFQMLRGIYGAAEECADALLSQLEECLVEEVERFPYDLNIKSSKGKPVGGEVRIPSVAQYLDDDDMAVTVEPWIDDDGMVSYLEVSRIDGDQPHIGPAQARMLHFSRALRDGERVISRDEEDRIVAAEGSGAD